MRTDLMKILVLGITVLYASAPTSAHHSVSAEFDVNSPITFTGTVSKVDWLNPHIYTYVDVKEADGTVVTHKIEAGAPNSLYRRGWRPDSLKPGDVVTVEGIRAKRAESPNVGRASMTTVDGTVMFSGNAPR